MFPHRWDRPGQWPTTAMHGERKSAEIHLKLTSTHSRYWLMIHQYPCKHKLAHCGALADQPVMPLSSAATTPCQDFKSHLATALRPGALPLNANLAVELAAQADLGGLYMRNGLPEKVGQRRALRDELSELPAPRGQRRPLVHTRRCRLRPLFAASPASNGICGCAGHLGKSEIGPGERHSIPLDGVLGWR